ncbi:hypothetical protein ABT034_34160 [Streptomyces sp. NPDC002773]|uniref:hypothetical protein n=1 Tax=Streptomyces sp. NPDC002773 TaxID=3154430 RepID=UPI00331D73EC
MICPHCAAGLTAKERTGFVCSRCDRPFALDPRSHGRGMNDLRIRRIAAHATDGGRRKVTVTQLWYLSRTFSGTWGPSPARGVRPLVRWLVALPLALPLFILSARADGAWSTLSGAAALALVAAATLRKRTPARPGGSLITPYESRFRELMEDRWRTTYGQLPPGVVDDGPHAPALPESPVGRPVVVLLCTDHAVAVFLRANGIPARLKALLVEAEPAVAHDALADVPGGLPVVVLHDASALGALLAPLLRLAHPDRVVLDAGLPVAAVRHRRGAVHRVAPPRAVDAADLRSVAGLSEEDAVWLAEGFWSPLAAVPPARLESVVTEAVERATAAGPSDLRAAHGFLTWPAGEPTTLTGETSAGTSSAGTPSRTKGAQAG